MKLFLSAFILLSASVTAYAAADSEMLKKGCILISRGAYTCPKKGCTTPYSGAAGTDKKVLVCSNLEMDGIATHVYDESGPFRYVYDEKQYAELVKSGNTLRDAVANKNLKSVNPALKEIEEFYSKELYDTAVFQNKLVEIAAVLWSSAEYKKQCRILEGNVDQMAEWNRAVADIIKYYQEVYKEFVAAQVSLGAIAKQSKSSQLAPLEWQINMYKMYNQYLSVEFGIKSYGVVLNKMKSAQTTALHNSQVYDKQLRRQFELYLIGEVLGETKKRVGGFCKQVSNTCDRIYSDLADIEKLLNDYAVTYSVLKEGTIELNGKLNAIEVNIMKKIAEMPDNNKGNWKELLQNEMKDMISLRKKSGLECVKDITPNVISSASAFAKSVGLSEGEKNASNFILIWNESEVYFGQPFQRIGYFNRVNQFLTQVMNWRDTAVKENNANIKKVEKLLRDTRKSLGMSEFDTLEEAKLKTSSYVLNHPDFVELGQYKSTGIWYAQMKDPRGKPYSMEIYTEEPGYQKDICYGIIKGGCKAAL